jgi:hypothetical protein
MMQGYTTGKKDIRFNGYRCYVSLFTAKSFTFTSPDVLVCYFDSGLSTTVFTAIHNMTQ